MSVWLSTQALTANSLEHRQLRQTGFALLVVAYSVPRPPCCCRSGVILPVIGLLTAVAFSLGSVVSLVARAEVESICVYVPQNVPPALLIRFLREHRSEWADCDLDADAAAALKTSTYGATGRGSLCSGQLPMPLSHAAEQEEVLIQFP